MLCMSVEALSEKGQMLITHPYIHLHNPKQDFPFLGAQLAASAASRAREAGHQRIWMGLGLDIEEDMDGPRPKGQTAFPPQYSGPRPSKSFQPLEAAGGRLRPKKGKKRCKSI